MYFIIQLTALFTNYFLLNANAGIETGYKFHFENKYLSWIYSLKKSFFLSKINYEIFSLYKKLFILINDIKNISAYIEYKKTVISYLRNNKNPIAIYHIDVLMNFCTLQTRLGIKNEFFKREALITRGEYLKYEYIENKENKYISPSVYRNFIFDCIRVNDLKYLKYFISICTLKFVKKDKDNLINYGLAFYYFHKNNFSGSRNCIENININRFLFKYDLILLRLRLNYETNEMELFESEIHNYLKKVRDDKIMTNFDKKAYIYPIRYLRKLSLLKTSGVTMDSFILAEKIKKEIDESKKTFQLKTWIAKAINKFIEENRQKIYKRNIKLG